MRLGDLNSLKEKLSDKNYITYTHEYGDAIPVEWVMNAIDNTPTIIWCSETSDGLPLMDLRPRPQGECKTCRHRDPEDKKCDCGGLERQGCPFPVNDDYYCKYYERGGAE